jgi:hypothetical protein
VSAARPRVGADERGSVTAELAIALPAVAALLAFALALGAGIVTQLRCGDGARAGAREAALGGADTAVAAAARAAAGGEGVLVSVVRSGGEVVVSVTARVEILGLGRAITGRATAACEPDRACGLGP